MDGVSPGRGYTVAWYTGFVCGEKSGLFVLHHLFGAPASSQVKPTYIVSNLVAVGSSQSAAVAQLLVVHVDDNVYDGDYTSIAVNLQLFWNRKWKQPLNRL